VEAQPDADVAPSDPPGTSASRAVRAKGFEHGDGNALYRLDQDAPLKRAVFHVSIAQPRVSKTGISEQQAELLAATEVYLHESSYATLDVICSA
jgi:hypothetical protein